MFYVFNLCYVSIKLQEQDSLFANSFDDSIETLYSTESQPRRSQEIWNMWAQCTKKRTIALEIKPRRLAMRKFAHIFGICLVSQV